MRAVVQRTGKARVTIDGKTVGKIERGLLIFLAIHKDDIKKKIDKMIDKIINLRMIEDGQGRMNLSVKDTQGEILVVSQFTLYGDTRKGKRPSFTESAAPDKALHYYTKFVKDIKNTGLKVATGEFGAMMEVKLVNKGPVTIIIDL